jgi:serine/threonine protein kinase
LGVDEKADIYSFGCLLYELVSGREPWEGCHPLFAICQVQARRPACYTAPACSAPRAGG